VPTYCLGIPVGEDAVIAMVAAVDIVAVVDSVHFGAAENAAPDVLVAVVVVVVVVEFSANTVEDNLAVLVEVVLVVRVLGMVRVYRWVGFVAKRDEPGRRFRRWETPDTLNDEGDWVVSGLVGVVVAVAVD
jgi:hypothetical protein